MLSYITRKINIKTIELYSVQFGLKVHTYLKCVQMKRIR